VSSVNRNSLASSGSCTSTSVQKRRICAGGIGSGSLISSGVPSLKYATSPLVKHPFVTVPKLPVLNGMFWEAATRAQDASVRQYTVPSSTDSFSPVALAVEGIVVMAACCSIGCAVASMSSPSGSPLRSSGPGVTMKPASTIIGTATPFTSSVPPPNTEGQGSRISLSTSSSSIQSINPLARWSFEWQGSSASGGTVMTNGSNLSRDLDRVARGT